MNGTEKSVLKSSKYKQRCICCLWIYIKFCGISFSVMLAIKSKYQNKSTGKPVLQNHLKISVEGVGLSMEGVGIILVAVSNR